MPPPNPRRNWIEVDPDALVHNARAARAAAGGAAVMAVVKADGYGHGLREVTRALAPEVEAFGVATLAEALAVREAVAPGAMVMVLGALLPDEREPALRAGIQVTVSSRDEAEAYNALALESGTPAPVHLVVDTGMGRIGFLEGDFAGAAREVAELPGLEVVGMATHFPSADGDAEFTAGQIGRFAALCADTGLEPRWKHLANSAGVLGFGAAGGNMVRPGLMLYGAQPAGDGPGGLRPALRWRARITQVRLLPAGSGVSYGRRFVATGPTRVATVAVGYGDGYPRHLSGSGAEVSVSGRRCPLLGNVTMDQIMVDVGACDPPPAPGDIATLVGASGGDAPAITVEELARRAGTIPWEILTGIGPRVARSTISADSGTR